MAKNGSANGQDSANAQHNVGARADRIRSGFNEIYELEQEIAQLTETHLKKVKEARTKAWRELKADTNVTRKVLKAQYDQYKLARDAQAFTDEDERDKVLDDMKEVFQALHTGQTVDWVSLIEKTLPDQASLGA